MTTLSKSNALSWPSGYGAGEILKNYPVSPGTIKVLEANLVSDIKYAARQSAPNGGRSRGGLQYINDPTGEPYAVVLSSFSEDDIKQIPAYMKWQGRRTATKVHKGMKIFVLPSDSLTKEKPFAKGIEFRLA
jgi:hypothetical protein